MPCTPGLGTAPLPSLYPNPPTHPPQPPSAPLLPITYACVYRGQGDNALHTRSGPQPPSVYPPTTPPSLIYIYIVYVCQGQGDALHSRTGHHHQPRCWATATSGVPPTPPSSMALSVGMTARSSLAVWATQLCPTHCSSGFCHADCVVPQHLRSVLLAFCIFTCSYGHHIIALSSPYTELYDEIHQRSACLDVFNMFDKHPRRRGP